MSYIILLLVISSVNAHMNVNSFILTYFQFDANKSNINHMF